jgi:hypothetical protein
MVCHWTFSIEFFNKHFCYKIRKNYNDWQLLINI